MSCGHLLTFSEPLFPYLSDRDKEACLRRWLWELTDIRGIKAPSSELHSWARQLRVPSIPYSGVLCFLCPPIQDQWEQLPTGKVGERRPWADGILTKGRLQAAGLQRIQPGLWGWEGVSRQ